MAKNGSENGQKPRTTTLALTEGNMSSRDSLNWGTSIGDSCSGRFVIRMFCTRTGSTATWCRATGPRTIMGTLTVAPLLTILPQLETLTFGLSEKYENLVISAIFGVWTAEKWLKKAQNTWNTHNLCWIDPRVANIQFGTPLALFHSTLGKSLKSNTKILARCKSFWDSKFLLEISWKVGFDLSDLYSDFPSTGKRHKTWI